MVRCGRSASRRWIESRAGHGRQLLCQSQRNQSAIVGNFRAYPGIGSKHERRCRVTLRGATAHSPMPVTVLHRHVLHVARMIAAHFCARHAVQHSAALAHEGVRCADRRKRQSEYAERSKDEPDHQRRI